MYTKTKSNGLDLDAINDFNNAELTFHESLELNDELYSNVYTNIKDGDEASKVFYSKEKGLIRFTDQLNNLLTLDSIIYN